jgi:uncharacterized membrane protein YjdF
MEIVYFIALILLIAAPRILRHFLGIHVPLGLEIATAIFLVLTLFFGSINNYYEKFGWWDFILHFASGLILTPWALITMRKLNTHGNEVSVSPVFIAFYASCFSVALAAMWEMYEFAYDIFLNGSMTESGLPDTLGDMIANLVSTVIVAIIVFMRMKRTRKIPLTKLSLN